MVSRYTAWSTIAELTREDFAGRVLATGRVRLDVTAGGQVAIRVDGEQATAGDPRREVLVAAAGGLEAFRWWAETGSWRFLPPSSA